MAATLSLLPLLPVSSSGCLIDGTVDSVPLLVEYSRILHRSDIFDDINGYAGAVWQHPGLDIALIATLPFGTSVRFACSRPGCQIPCAEVSYDILPFDELIEQEGYNDSAIWADCDDNIPEF